MISIHPNGNIAEFLTSAGLAKVIDVSLLTQGRYKLMGSGTLVSLPLLVV